MYSDLIGFNQTSINSVIYSHSSKKLAVVLNDGVLIYVFSNGLVKNEIIKISAKEFNQKDYKLGEPEGPIFPILKLPSTNINKDIEFKIGSFSDIYLPSLGGGFQLLVLTTSNSNTILLKSPDISSTSLIYTWECVSNISDILYQSLLDREFNKPIKENKTIFVDRNLNPRPYTPETEAVSNLEFKKRSEWFSPRAFGWSNVMKFESKEGVENGNKMVLLTVGTKRGIILYKCILPDLNSVFNSNNLSLFKLIETNDWAVALCWKPTFAIEQLDQEELGDHGIMALALGDGSVLLQIIHGNGQVELLDTILEADYTPASFLEWGPINDLGQSYLVICKGLGFYIYNFEKKKLSSFILAHRDKISYISFSDYSHFSTTSYDNNIIEYKIENKIWDDQQSQIVPTSIGSIGSKDEVKIIGISSVLSSPNRLITIYTSETPFIETMFQRAITSRLSISYKTPIYNFQSFKTSFLQKFKDEESRNIWDFFLYINVYSNEEILEFINELLEEQSENKLVLYKAIIKLYYILKKKSKDFKDEQLELKIDELKLYIKLDYVINLLKSFLSFISQEKEYTLLDYQKTSLSLMVRYLTSDSKDHSQICNKVIKIIGKSTPFEVCVYCSKEIPIGEKVDNIVECPECQSDIERCSRTFLLISTPKTLNCDYCYSRSLVFINEDSVENPTQVLDQSIFEKSSIRYQFPWINIPNSACVFCRTPLNGLSSDDRCVFP